MHRISKIDKVGVKELKELMDNLEEASQSMYTCLRGPRPSAALIITMGDNVVVPGGVYPPRGRESCIEAGECMIEDGHCVRNNHAEVDALLHCATKGIETWGAICLSINKPCYQCTRALIAAHVQHIYYRYAVYDEPRTNEALIAAGIRVDII